MNSEINFETNISQDAYDYLKDLCLKVVEDSDVMIIAKLLSLHEIDARAKIILDMNDLEIRLKAELE